MLRDGLTQAIVDFEKYRGSDATLISVDAPDPWHVDLRFMPTETEYRTRSIVEGDEIALATFGSLLGDWAREMFCPYPWDEAEACAAAFRHAVEQSVRRIDASYLIDLNGQPMGHFFLWKAGGNPVSQRVGLEVPELGVAIADAHAGKGLGSLAVRILLAAAADIGADAVELTTAAENDAGWRVYRRTGFTYAGMLRIPLGVDVTAADAGEAVGALYRIERQMVNVLQPAKRAAVLAYLASKRGEN